MILHKSPREVARTMSFPECRLVLAQQAEMEAAELLAATHSRTLGARGTSQHLDDFMARLDRTSRGERATPPPRERATQRNLSTLFGGLGLRAAPAVPD